MSAFVEVMFLVINQTISTHYNQLEPSGRNSVKFESKYEMFFKKMYLNMTSTKQRLFHSGFTVVIKVCLNTPSRIFMSI